MGKRRRKFDVKPWCWYCDREFEDEKVLMNHQKARHFKCHVCNKKMNTSGGLVVHVSQVHKETISTIPNTLPGRDSPSIEICGMMGIPEKDLMAYLGKTANDQKLKKNKVDVTAISPDTIKQQMEQYKMSKINKPAENVSQLVQPPVYSIPRPVPYPMYYNTAPYEKTFYPYAPYPPQPMFPMGVWEQPAVLAQETLNSDSATGAIEPQRSAPKDVRLIYTDTVSPEEKRALAYVDKQ